MKVCHISTVHRRTDTRVFHKQCRSLAEHGHDITLIIADGLGNNVEHGVKIIDVGSKSASRLLRASLFVVKAIKAALKEKADLYQAHDPELMPAMWLIRILGKKSVIDIHEDLQGQILRKYWMPKWLAMFLLPAIKVAEWISCKVLSGVVTVTPKLFDRYRQMGGNVLEVRNYPKLSEFNSVSTNIREDVDNFTIAYVGGIAKDRGIDTMLNALQKAPAVRLNLAGSFSNGELGAYCENHPAWSQVNFHGWSTREEISEILSQSHIGMVVLKATGDYEDALPVKMFEYMAANIPVISSDFPLWRTVIEEAKCGYVVDPEDADGLAALFQTIADDRDSLTKMGISGANAVKNKFNWDGEFEELVSFYQNIIRA